MLLAQRIKSGLRALNQPTDSAVRNYLTLRKTIGILGLALPLVVWAGAWMLFGTGLQPTISDYYYTGMRDVFVGILWAIGIFLVCYRGPRLWDEVASSLAGFCAIGVALFPVAPAKDASSIQRTIGKVHYVSAIGFFLTITVMVLFLFKNRGKAWANRFYKLCGAAMAGSLACMAAWGVSFAAETIAVMAFGSAWLVNGIGMFKPPEDRPPPGAVKPNSAFA